ncbi:hypothetical protein CLAFUW4_05446 [Fulvia fulva]|uniref:Uncharacterized protein n=1 Tax=Passalora fulva TaxID=5499 RepID=A0A9Q8LIM8_PASFU|nr:uncharacterized protein CLAFUR5_05590 [Fulvia fulva]KAK4624079.1 hypothetical protein CLAFUR4_05440 [Fulvia fulva]KAK4625205.1 hypothetical protein CLAFUR0_05448 [Fulvia fulva]UJO17829.1 hypothetical protein CLAFUR5_05590 [Fulvia fulva]WPV14850.1 hypothetical protein CLAFUW4_05446 [Fulvia fulva]WPV30571.1 hypothetical protein CLAFUW7_05444 [Fulvia fulva]
MTTAMATTATQTLDLLEARLQRLSFLLSGDGNGDDEHPSTSTSTSTSTTPAKVRLAGIERNLKSLAARSPAVADVLQLHRAHPDLFNASSTSTPPSTLPTASLAQLVLAHEQLYKTTNSQLTTANDSKNIPDPSSLTKLIGLTSRIDAAEAKQVEQAREFAELRGRSAKIVEKWYEEGVLDMGERWADWEERLRDAEILVRRREAAKRREEAGV